jgi:tetratricopeptide (TPR) repeat protein
MYCYVWIEGVRNMEMAVQKDPNSAGAWWGLSRAFERWRRAKEADECAKKAYELRDKASHREQMLIKARMEERGLLPNLTTPEAKKNAAAKTLDDMLAIYDDDQEAWFCRAQIAADGRTFGGTAASLPYYKALLRINPIHCGAAHEMVHYYEQCQRPALGWDHSENFIKGAPGIPHSWHMQSHLATRLGRWHKSSESSSKAVALEQAYHKEMNIQPRQDEQYSHHCETLLRSLVHDGRFKEGRILYKEMETHQLNTPLTWYSLFLNAMQWDDAMKIAERQRKTDKSTGSYLSAMIHLLQGHASAAEPEVQVLEEANRTRKGNRRLELRLWETRGLLMCQTGNADEGLKLLFKCVTTTKDDYQHHAWGNGAYYMERWGLAALRCGRFDQAEEGFLEALAHDSGSVYGAMGMQVLCEHLGRTSEAIHYAELARKFWSKAEAHDFNARMKAVRGQLDTYMHIQARPSWWTPEGCKRSAN